MKRRDIGILGEKLAGDFLKKRGYINTLSASELSWVSGEAPEEPVNVTAKIRYRSPEVATEFRLTDGTAKVNFHQPQRAIAPGQAIVFYQGDTVLGGGTITNADTILC